MRSSDQGYIATERRRHGGESSCGEDATLVDRIDLHAEFYRGEAQRLLALAAASPFEDAKRQFLGLARQYETLAEHAARRSERGL